MDRIEDKTPYYVSLVLSGMFLILFLFLVNFLTGNVAYLSIPFGGASFIFLLHGIVGLSFSLLQLREVQEEGK